MTYSFDPAAAGVGVHTLTYTFTNGSGCTGSASDMVQVFALPTVAFTAPADLCINDGVQTGLGGGTPPEGTTTGDMGVYSGMGVTDDGNGMTYSFDPAIAGVGIHTLTYTYTDENGCTNSASDDVQVFAVPSVTFTAPADLCITAGVQMGLGSGMPTGGVYSGTGVTDDGNGMTYSFDPAAAGVGTHTITYTVGVSGCSGMASDDVEVYALPNVSLTISDSFCETDAPATVDPMESPSGGVYSGPGVTDDGNGDTFTFSPGTAGVGTHIITYGVTDMNGCSASNSATLTVSASPTATFTVNDITVCEGGSTLITPIGDPPSTSQIWAETFSQNGAGITGACTGSDPSTCATNTPPANGQWSVTGNAAGLSASDDFFRVNSGQLEGQDIDAELCFLSEVIDITGLTAVDFSVDISETGDLEVADYVDVSYIIDGGVTTLIPDWMSMGNPIHTLIGDTPTDADWGSTTVTQSGLSGSTLQIEICMFHGGSTENMFIDNVIVNGESPGSLFKFYDADPGAGPANLLAGPAASYDPMTTSGTSPQTVYVVECETPCNSTALPVVVTVNALPTVTFTAPADLCVNAGVQAGLGGGTPTGGVYSGTGVTDDGNGMTYSFDPAAAGVGVHTITYDFTDTNGCTGSASDMVEVFAVPTVAFTAPADLCIDAGVQAGLGGGTPTGGVYSGTGVTDDGNGMTYSFDPAAAGAGVHTITYDFTDSNGCSGSASDMIEVFALPTVTFTALADLCINAGVQTGLGGGTPTGGVYSGPGVTDDGNGMTYTFDPAVAGVGVHTLTYDFTDSNGCSGSASDMVEVFAVPTVAFTAPADLCVDAGVQAGLGGGTPTGGVYSGTGVTDDGNGMTYSFDPAAAGVGTHTITYDFTDTNGCTGSASDDVEVLAVPSVSLSTALYYCLDAPIQTAPLTGGSPTGGVYSGPGVTDGGNGLHYFLDPTVGGPGTITITYTVTDANGCSSSATSTIDIIDCTFEATDPCACLDNATVIDLDAGTGGDDGQFSELVSIVDGQGGMLPGTQTWTVVGAMGAFDAYNIPPIGTQSAGVPVATDGSVTLTFNMLLGTYELPFVHVDALGYTLMVEGPFMMGSAANSTITISNTCQYPNPILTLQLLPITALENRR